MLLLKKSYKRVHHIFVRSTMNYNRICICLKCYHRFADYYGLRRNIYNPQLCRDAHVYCPYCGCQYFYQEYHNLTDNNFGLWDLNISLYMFKEKIKIVLTGSICRMDGKFFSDTCENVKELIEFDVGKRLTMFKQTRGSDSIDVVSFELGNPVHLNRFLQLSLLNNIKPHSMVYKDKFWTTFLKIIREELMKKLITKHNIFSKGWYETYSSYSEPNCGKIIPSLFNYAFRMRHPSFQNYNFSSRFWGLEKFVSPSFDTCAIPLNENHCKILCKSIGLPYSKELRAYIAEDFNRCILLHVLNQKFNINSSNLLLDRDMLDKFLKLLFQNFTQWNLNKEDQKKSGNKLILFLIFLHNKFKTVPFKKLLQIKEFNDCLSMFTDLPNSNKENFRTEKIRTREIHDRLIHFTNQLRNSDYNLDVPKEIVNRFLMQKDRLKAFIPEHSSLLADAGRNMQICVGGYAKRVVRGDCIISFLSDDKGKVVACLEIKGSKLVQAKLFGNRCVKENTEINAFVVEYAKKTGLGIDTDDVNREVVIENNEVEAI